MRDLADGVLAGKDVVSASELGIHVEVISQSALRAAENEATDTAS